MTQKKRIPFSIEAWKAGGVPVTKDGQQVHDLHYLKSFENDWPVIGVIDNTMESWSIDGRHYLSQYAKVGDRYVLELEMPDVEFPDVMYLPCHMYAGHLSPLGFGHKTIDDAKYYVNRLHADQQTMIYKVEKIKP